MRKSILRASAGLQALALLGAGTAASFIVAAPAAAQDYTSGVITGTVRTDAGAPIAGATVTARSEQQGWTRSTTTSAAGQFSFSSLPPGDYDVTVQAAGVSNFRADNVQVIAGATSDLPIVMTSATAEGATGGEVVVVGRLLQAFTGTTTGVNLDVEDLVKTVPVGQNLTSLVLLAPSTNRGDTAFGNLASIGGSSVAENAYYINGLNITNFDNYLGSAEVPFYFYKNVEVKSGGYPAEFGRATGGIINAVSKAGTNEYTGAVHVSWAPDFLRSTERDQETCSSDGTCAPLTNREDDWTDTYSVAVEGGGPIIRDRLFVYGLLEVQKQDWFRAAPASDLGYHYTNDDPFWAVKVDAYPIDDHHLEFTIFDTRNTTRRENQEYLLGADGEYSRGAVVGSQDYNYGGVNFVGKYTGRFTDWLTLSAAYGRMRDRFDIQFVDAGGSAPYYVNASGGTIFGVGPGGAYNGQTTSLYDFPYETQRKFYRADADITFDMFGHHHVRLGVDRENNTLNHATVRPGNSLLCGTGFLSAAACANTGAGAAIIFRNGLAGQDPQVEINYLVSGGGFTARNQAAYIQDEWNVTDRLTLNLGLRRDDFRLNKQDGTVFLESKGNYAPRIGATYEMWPDKSGTLKAFFGQYFLPFASNTAARQAASELYFRERFYFTGLDANGLPILGAQVTDYPAYNVQCPFGLTPVSSGQNCSVSGAGETPLTTQGTDAGLKATRESEYILGYEHKLNNGWRVGLTGVYRSLDTSAEDVAIDAAARTYCIAEGFAEATCNAIWSGYHQYVITNPGTPMTVALNAENGPFAIPELHNRVVTLDPADLGYPKAKRTYKALEFTFNKPWNEVYSLNGSYTLSWSKGNSEGMVQSDFGQDDAGITQDFDQPGFTEHSSGYLPNDRRHRFKLWGSYALTPDLILGTQIQVMSPRHLSCLGYYPVEDSLENGYGAASHYCGGVPAPRGTGLRSGWYQQVDLSSRYNLHIGTGQIVTLRADIFNVFNAQAVMQRNEVGEIGFGVANPNYGKPRAYQTPRYVRLGLDIAFGGGIAPPPPPVEVVAPPPPVVEAPATQTCGDGTVILATEQCPAPPPPPPPPPAAPERG